MDPITVLTAFIPLVSTVITRVVDHFTGGPKPQNVDEQLKLNTSEISRMQAMANMDKAEGVSYWVANVRAMMRPTAVFMILTVWGLLAVANGTSVEVVQNLAASAVFYLFGERTQMYIDTRKMNKK